MDLKSRLAKELTELKENSMFREMRLMHNRNQSMLEWEGKNYVNLSSNDYLGLGFDQSLLRDFYSSFNDDAVDKWAFGSTSSRLLTGNSAVYNLLETKLADLYGKESALVFNSGYHANIGILPALTDKNDLILSDKLNHASIIDGLRLNNADVQRYRHLDFEHLEYLLSQKRSKYRYCIIVTESVFSMDGDVAELQQLVQIKEKYDCQLYVDEAHAVACRGKKGLGICEESAMVQDIDFIVGTFGKAWASQGAFIVCDKVYTEYLTNKMRSLVFTTALPPVNLFWSLFIADKLGELQPKREYLWQLSKKLQSRLVDYGYPSASDSNILPIMVGNARDTIQLAEHMQSKGLLIFPIRPPTVPEGTSRLRISLCANIKEEQLNPMWEVFDNY